MTVPRLRRPEPGDAEIIAGWSRSAEEASRWCSRPLHPFPAAEVANWWKPPDVEAWVLELDEPATPAAYGELWVDDEEDEVELARVIVHPDRRRRGLGRQLVDGLVAAARATGRAECFLRVASGNLAALALYRAAGFVEVDFERSRAWNAGQPADFTWLERLDFGSTG